MYPFLRVLSITHSPFPDFLLSLIIRHKKIFDKDTKFFYIFASMKEEATHKVICEYIKIQYPWVEFTTDMSGIRLPMGLATKASKLRSTRAFPDIMIFEPNQEHYGLFLEVKADRKAVFRKDGSLRDLQHIREQQAKIESLIKRGFLAMFVWEFEQSKVVIDNYLSKVHPAEKAIRQNHWVERMVETFEKTR